MGEDSPKPSVVKKPTDEPLKRQLQEQRRKVIGDWLCRYAEIIRDGWGQPTQISSATIDAYDSFLRNCPQTDLLEEAMRIAGSTARNFPRPDQIRAAYTLVLERESGRAAVCEQCGGCGYVQGLYSLERCPLCSPGTAGYVEFA
jgi:hypothetical protein